MTVFTCQNLFQCEFFLRFTKESKTNEKHQNITISEWIFVFALNSFVSKVSKRF